jgi:hypothetical protein
VFGPGKTPVGEVFWAVEGGAALEPELRMMEDGAEHASMAVNDVTVERLHFVDETEAEVGLGFWMAGSTTPVVMPGSAVFADGDWRVSRSTIVQFASLTQQHRRPD